jgi:hypothetical protein
MKRKTFTSEQLKKLLNYDAKTGVFTRRKPWGSRKVGDVPGSLSKQGYWQIGVFNQTYSAQVLAWLYVYGEWPSNLVDHINGNRTDNRIENLQLLNYSANFLKAKISSVNTSGVKGVHFSLQHSKRPSNKPWCANITSSGKRIFLGCFATLEEATLAREKAEDELI